MKFYSYDEIREAGNCREFAESVLGCEINNQGRCQALWRGGDGWNVSINEHEWHDHKSKIGGGLLELCAEAKFDGNKQDAQNFLGEWLKLEPKFGLSKAPMSSAKYDSLINDGYKEVKRYGYYDLNGELVHFVSRLEHSEKGKEFLQGNPNGWGLKGITPILYRMADWIESTYVCIVEGEKDADTLNDIGIPATTNCGGSEKWNPGYSKHFKGKNIAIIRDNDKAGESHAKRVSRELKDIANLIVVICPSSQPKGDVTDWIQHENGTAHKLVELIKSAPKLDVTELEDVDPLVEQAKLANRKDLSNFTEQLMHQGKITKSVKTARQINHIIEDVHKRFIGFPRRVGNSKFMFDHDRETGEIVHIHDAAELFSWIGRKSKHRVAWTQGDSFVTKPELYKGLHAEAQIYEAISDIPDYPKRDDVYYTHGKLPRASKNQKYLNQFLDFFSPANEAYRTMLKAFICAPLWYIEGIPRPGWIIDTEDGAGTGKTTMVELVSRLYSGSPIRTNKQELKQGVDKIVKRMLSTEGRRGRILLVDNVTGQFNCSELADFMTAESISGIAAYGRGEETRPNNLTYVITANSATVDNDLSDRCYYVFVKRPKRSGSWKSNVLKFIREYRLHIIADIVSLLKQGRELPDEPQTRFPEFEQSILNAVCVDDKEYNEAINMLVESRSASNVEDDQAKTAEEEIRARLIDENLYPHQQKIFIRSEVIKLWMQDIFDQNELHGHPVQALKNWVKNGLTSHFDLKPERYPTSSNDPRRKRGIMWIPNEYSGEMPTILGMKKRKIVKI